MIRILLAMTVGLAALTLAACGNDDTLDTVTDVSITATDGLRFEPDEFAVPAGEEVTVTFTAESSVEHDLRIEGVGMAATAGDEGHGDEHAMEDDDLHVAHADAGETVTATFTVDEAGTYQVYCSVPGHRGAGMEATLTVVDDS
jgi:uncharacterized cupredoxin-like copper-binding protein